MVLLSFRGANAARRMRTRNLVVFNLRRFRVRAQLTLHAPRNDFLFCDQCTISNNPAEPMPPPTHMVTTAYLALRRRPSIRAWPARRAPDMP